MNFNRLFFACIIGMFACCTSPASDVSTQDTSIVPKQVLKPAYTPLTPQLRSKNDTVGIETYMNRLKKIDNRSEYNFFDLDLDGKNELVTSYYTGGVHCCNTVEIYRLGDNDLFVLDISIEDGYLDTDGNVCVSLQSLFGLFYSCIACDYEQLHNDVTNQISFRYTSQGLQSLPTDTTLNTKIIENLEQLSGFDIRASADQSDNGERKAFAKNIAVYHFNNRQTIEQSYLLFKKYYHHTNDENEVWSGIESTLRELHKRYVLNW